MCTHTWQHSDSQQKKVRLSVFFDANYILYPPRDEDIRANDADSQQTHPHKTKNRKKTVRKRCFLLYSAPHKKGRLSVEEDDYIYLWSDACWEWQV